MAHQMLNSEDANKFFGQAVARTSPTSMAGVLRLAAECSIYFNEHRDAFNQLAQKLTYILDSIYPRSKGFPSFENKVWALALIAASWNGFFREAIAIDKKIERERQLLVNVTIPSLAKAAQLGREYARIGIRRTEDI